MFPAQFLPPITGNGVLLGNLYHTPFGMYFRVADPTPSVPLPPVIIGKENVIGYDDNGNDAVLIEPAIGVYQRVQGDPKRIGSLLYMAIYDKQPANVYARNFAKSPKPYSVNMATDFGGDTSAFKIAHVSRKCFVANVTTNNQIVFGRYRDGEKRNYARDAFFNPAVSNSNAWNNGANAAATNLAFNAANASYAYNRYISSNEWCYAAGYGGDRNQIIGYKGRHPDDEDDPLNELPLWIAKNNAPAGECYGIQGIGVIGDDFAVMQGVYIEDLGWPNSTQFNATYNPYPQTTNSGNLRRLFSVRVCRIDLIDGVAYFSIVASVINGWRQIAGTGSGGIPAAFEPYQVSSGGEFLTAIGNTKDDGVISVTYPWNGSNINGQTNLAAAFFEVNPSVWVRLTRSVDAGGKPIWQYSRNKGSSWTSLPRDTLSSPGTGLNSSYRGSSCVRHDFRLEKDRYNFVISKEVQL